VPATALALALAAAVLHAGWNVLLAGSRDVLAATVVAVGTSVVLAAPVALVVRDVEREAIPFLVASGLLEVVYFFSLAAAYARAEVSVVYPVARGGAPVLVLVGALLLGTVPSAAESAGILLVAAGILLVRRPRSRDPAGLALGLAIAALIAMYTLVDAEGIEHAHPITYLELVLLPTAIAGAAAVRGERLRLELRPATVLAGVGGFAAYALALAALRLAPAASVAAVRETSVVVAVVLAGVVLREPVGPRRLLGAVVVAAGVGVLAVA
jgi:drug/metabolite transporter (DMT)-like permease